MPIKCLLIDDEPPAIELLKKHISLFNNLEVSATAHNAVEAINLLEKHHIDLMFLDIEMPSLTGLELLKTLSNPPKIIITTAYREYAAEGYEFDVVDYLLKPISLERFAKAIDRYQHRVKDLSKKPEVTDSFFYVSVSKKNYKVNFADLCFVQSLKDYTRLHLVDKQLLVKGNIGKFEALLPQNLFVRVHRSYIVSLNKISAFTSHDIEIGDIEIPIGVSYKTAIQGYLKGKKIED